MKKNISIKLKAAFLLMVFALNTVIGFGCAIGMDMGFNSKHHSYQQAGEPTIHIHKDGKKHVHSGGKEQHNKDKSHCHDHTANGKSDSGKDDCCKDKVTTFGQLDKSVPQSLTISHPVFFTSFISVFYNIDAPILSLDAPGIKYFVRIHHPPISDIRLAIQSFQI